MPVLQCHYGCAPRTGIVGEESNAHHQEDEIKKGVFMIVFEGNAGNQEEEDPCPASTPYHRPIDGRSDDVHVFEHAGDG